MDLIADISGSLEIALFGICALVYIFLSVFLAYSWRKAGPGNWLIFASIATAFWAGAIALEYASSSHNIILIGNMGETIRSIAWAAFIFSIFERGKQQFIEALPESKKKSISESTTARTMTVAIIALNLFLMSIDGYVLVAFEADFGSSFENYALYYYVVRLFIAVFILMLLENIYRWSGEDFRWGVRMLVLALAGQNIFDVVVYADALLFGSVQSTLLLARPGIAIVIAPLLLLAAARNPGWRLNVFVSRRSVFHTLSLIGVGSYLSLTALAGYLLKEVGGSYSTLFQIIAVFAAIIFLIAMISSGSIRAAVRVFLSKHFFAYNYDYRDEWLQFVKTVSENSALDLRSKVIKALCDIVDSPGGALWLIDETKSVLRPDARWNFSGGVDGVEPLDSEFAIFLQEKGWVIELEGLRAGDPIYQGLAVPKWVRLFPLAWFVIPVIRQEELDGIFIIEKPRAKRSLDWEDRDILKTVALQSASYIAEQRSEKMLAETKQFREFSARFSFVVHDIKNLTSQLNLLVQNAERHIDNPDFRIDMLETLKGSVEKMHVLLARLNSQSELGLTDAEDIEVNELLSQVVGKYTENDVSIFFKPEVHTLWITGHIDQLANIFGHLIQNAIEAIDHTGKVEVVILKGNEYANIEIKDNGCGMQQDFIENKLFEPFQTTKETGYGLGMAECRKVLNAHKGGLEIVSEIDTGTCIKVRIPLSQRSMDQSEPNLG